MSIIKNWVNKRKEQQQNKQFQTQFETRQTIVKKEIEYDTKAMEDARNLLYNLKELEKINGIDKRVEFVNQNPYFANWQSTTYQKQFLQNLISDDTKLKNYILSSEDDFLKRKYRLELKIKKFHFMRPNTTKDIEERNDTLTNLTNEIQKLDKQNKLNLRFHSTNIAATKDIIESGGLIASVDRLDGYQFDTGNNSNEISVTDIYGMQHSIESWTDLNAYNENMPAGCLFVLKPSSQQEIDMIQHRCMNNVYFNDNSGRFVAVVTTSENVDMVQQWLEKQGLDKKYAMTFATLSDYIKENFNLKEIDEINEDYEL